MHVLASDEHSWQFAVKAFVEGFVIVRVEQEEIAGAAVASRAVRACCTVWHRVRAKTANAKTGRVKCDFVDCGLIAANTLLVAVEEEQAG